MGSRDLSNPEHQNFYGNTAKMDLYNMKTIAASNRKHHPLIDAHFTTSRKHNTKIDPDLLEKDRDLIVFVAKKAPVVSSFGTSDSVR